MRRSKKVKIESGSASKPGPGRPLITGESSSETIRLSIEAAIDRYNKIKDATSNLEVTELRIISILYYPLMVIYRVRGKRYHMEAKHNMRSRL